MRTYNVIYSTLNGAVDSIYIDAFDMATSASLVEFLGSKSGPTIAAFPLRNIQSITSKEK